MAISNKELTFFAITREIEDLPRKQVVNVYVDQRKIATRKGVAQVLVSDEQVAVTNGANGVMVNERGTAICNPMHFAVDPSRMRVNSFWVINDEIMTTLPSTIYTPIPMLRYSRPPIADMITDLAKKLANLSS